MYAIFPKRGNVGLTAQACRCAVSIPANIAEGYGRCSTKDYVRFLNISRTSLYELLTLLEVSYNLKFINQKAYSETTKLTAEVGKMLTTLIKKIQHSNSLRIHS
jgi:four helix bundle protein